MNRLPLFALALCAGVSAQSITVATDSPYGVFARTPLNQDLQTLPALTILNAPTTISAAVLGADATTVITPEPTGVRISEAGRASLPTAAGRAQAGTTVSQLPGTVLQAPHSLLVKVTNLRPNPLHGKLVLTLTGNSDTGSGASLALDVGNDNSIDYTQAVDGQPHSKELAVTIATSLAIKVTTDAFADRLAVVGNTGYALSARLEFVAFPPPFEVSSYGTGCGGLQLALQDTVVGNVHQLTITQDGGFAAAPGALLFGGTQLALPIPGSNCFLYNEAILDVPFSSDPTGRSVLFLPVLAPVYGTAYVQGVSFTYTPPRFRTSNGLKVECNG